MRRFGLPHLCPLLLLSLTACMAANAPSPGGPDVVRDGRAAVSRVRSGSISGVSGQMAISYLADRETQLCFLLMEKTLVSYDATAVIAPVDCCALQRVPRMRAAVPWLDKASCRDRGFPGGSTPPPPAGATAPR